MDLQHATTKGSAAKPQSQQSDLEMAVEYLKKTAEINAAKLRIRDQHRDAQNIEARPPIISLIPVRPSP